MHPVTRNTERPASRLSLFVTVVTRVTRADDFAFRWPHHRRKRAGRVDSDSLPHTHPPNDLLTQRRAGKLIAQSRY